MSDYTSPLLSKRRQPDQPLKPFVPRPQKRCAWREGADLRKKQCTQMFTPARFGETVCCYMHSLAYQRLISSEAGKEQAKKLKAAAKGSL